MKLWRFERVMWTLARWLVPGDPWVERPAYRGRPAMTPHTNAYPDRSEP